jgi:hypothetical protein
MYPNGQERSDIEGQPEGRDVGSMSCKGKCGEEHETRDVALACRIVKIRPQ